MQCLAMQKKLNDYQQKVNEVLSILNQHLYKFDEIIAEKAEE